MTCIVGIIHRGAVWMGADSAGVSDYSLTVRRDPKVFVNGPMIFGFTSSFRMGQLLRHALKVPEHPKGKPDSAWLSVDFIDSVRAVFRDKGWEMKKDGRESGGRFLIGYRGHVYRCDDDFQIGQAACGYDAVGCGADIALGSLFSTKDGRNPTTRIRTALKAAEAFSAGVRGPFKILRGGHRTTAASARGRA